MIDEYWLQRLIENVGIPHYLTQKAYQLTANAKEHVDEDEILTLDASVPDYARQVFTTQVLSTDGLSQETLQNSTEKFMTVVYFAFRPFGCDQDVSFFVRHKRIKKTEQKKAIH